MDPDRRAWHLAHAAAGPDEDSRRGPGTVGRARSEPWRRRRRGSVLGAGGEVDRDPGLRSARALAAAEPSSTRPPSTPPTRWWRRRRPARSTSCGRVRWRCCGRSWSTPADGAMTPLRFSSTRPSASKGSMIALPARRILKHSARRSSPGGWVRTPTSVRSPRQPAAHRGASPARPVDLLLDGVASRFTDGYSAAAPLMRNAARALSPRRRGRCRGQHAVVLVGMDARRGAVGRRAAGGARDPRRARRTGRRSAWAPSDRARLLAPAFTSPPESSPLPLP